MMNKKLWIYFFLVLIFCIPVRSEEEKVLFYEDFNDLSLWKPLYFPKIKSHSEYSIQTEGNNSYLKAVSNASASGLQFLNEFDVYEYPQITWRWKITNVYEKGDAASKAGDDYPIRIYIMFTYNPKKATFRERITYSSAKLVRGEYPPHSSLNYIWANKEHKEKVLTSTYTDRSVMILLKEGSKHAGTWQTETINIINDYNKAFGKNPPVMASIAIMNDSDNTGEKSISYIDFITVFDAW